MKKTSTASIEIVLNLPPLDAYVKEGTTVAAYSLRCMGGTGDTTLAVDTENSILLMDILNKMLDRIQTIVDLEKYINSTLKKEVSGIKENLNL